MAIQEEFYDLHAQYASYHIDGTSITYDKTQIKGSAQVGKAVMLSAQRTVALVTTASEILGKLISVESDGTCTVQDEGYCDLPYDGSPTYTAANNGLVGGAAAGNVTVAAAAETATAVRRAIAICADSVSGRLIAKLN